MVETRMYVTIQSLQNILQIVKVIPTIPQFLNFKKDISVYLYFSIFQKVSTTKINYSYLWGEEVEGRSFLMRTEKG